MTKRDTQVKDDAQLARPPRVSVHNQFVQAMHTFTEHFSPPEYSPKPEQKTILLEYPPPLFSGWNFDGLELRKLGLCDFYCLLHLKKSRWLRDNNNRER